MAVSPSDLKWYYSGGATNSDPRRSVGGPISSTEVPADPSNNLFDDVAPDQASVGMVDYRCVYLRNTHASSPLVNATIWIAQDTASPDDHIEIGIDPAGIGGEAPLMADPSIEPPGVTFARPLDAASALVIGTLGPGQWCPIWIRRVVQPGAGAYGGNTFVLEVDGETY